MNENTKKCWFCENHESGDTLYESSDWDGGIGFDYIRDIKYCPICGERLRSESSSTNSTHICHGLGYDACDDCDTSCLYR